MDFFGEYRDVVEFLFGGVGVTLVGFLGVVVKKLKTKVRSISAMLEEEKAVSPGAALAMVYYDNLVKPLMTSLAGGAPVRVDGEPVNAAMEKVFVLWMPEDMPLDPELRRRYQHDLLTNRKDILKVTVQLRGRSHYLYGKREGGALKLFDQPISETTLSYFARVLDAGGRPKEMSERRKRELHKRERGVFGSTITNLAATDGFSDQVSVSTEPIAFL